MGKLFLHIGTPKTGTSAIQTFLGNNREIFKKKGYCYPDFFVHFDGVGENRNAHFLVQRFYQSGKKRDYEKEKSVQDKCFDILLKKLDAFPYVVMSDEGIWNLSEFFEGFWENLYKRISQAGHELQVIVYVRRQDAYIQSYWAQKVKETSTDSFQDFMEAKKYEKCHLDYEHNLDSISAVIGLQNVTVKVYEKEHYYGGSLLSDFLHIIGLELTDEWKISERTVNQSIAGKSLEIKRILNQVPEFKEKRSFLVEYLREITSKDENASDFSKAVYFKEGQRQQFLELYAKGNEYIAKKYLNNEDGILFAEVEEKEEIVSTEYSAEELVLACGEMLLMMEDKLKTERNKNGFIKKVGRKIKSFRR